MITVFANTSLDKENHIVSVLKTDLRIPLITNVSLHLNKPYTAQETTVTLRRYNTDSGLSTLRLVNIIF